MAAPNPDPIVVFIVRLFAAAAMADDGIPGTDRAAAQDDFRARLSPIGFEVVLCRRKWDKENRDHGGLCVGSDLPKSEPYTELSPPQQKYQLGKNNACRSPLPRAAAPRLAG